MSPFRKAERRQAKLKIALTAPSGGGKTMSALHLAHGIGKKIAVIDTENGSASLYADRFEFDTLELEPPYTISKYTQAIKAAQEAGYDVLIIDSISHAWAGEGGLLSKKEALDQRGGNSFSNWASITKEQEQFKSAILNAEIHLIVTMRSKQDYVLEINEKGKSSPRKVGLAPVQRDGMEYEFTTVFDIAMDHNAQVSKDRTGLFDGRIFTITKDIGKEIVAWLNGAKPAEPKPEPVKPTIVKPEGKASIAQLTDKQIARLFAIARSACWSNDDVRGYMGIEFGLESTKDMSKGQYEQICKYIGDNPKEETEAGAAG